MRARPAPLPAPVAHALFDTALGTCGLAWTSLGLLWIQLPERTRAATRTRMTKAIAAHPEAAEEPPAWVVDAMDRLRAHLDGKVVDLDGVRLDVRRVPPFFRKVYEVARAVPRGEVRSYAEIARASGSPAASRAVGQAMAKNPWPVVVPCHRIVASAGKPGGFSAAGGLDTKARLLALEGATLAAPGRRLKAASRAS